MSDLYALRSSDLSMAQFLGAPVVTRVMMLDLNFGECPHGEGEVKPIGLFPSVFCSNLLCLNGAVPRFQVTVHFPNQHSSVPVPHPLRNCFEVDPGHDAVGNKIMPETWARRHSGREDC